ncbi:Exportin-1 [Glugoides intestinalis]
MERILDLNSEFNIELFDNLVSTALNSSSPNKSIAENILLRFKDLPNSWTKIDCILKGSTSKQSQFIALQILEETVKSKWVLFNEEMKAGIRKYVFSTIIDRSSSAADIILQKFNSVLIEIVKKDWPNKWPNFINDLIMISQSTSMQVSMNSLIILKNINEQVFIVEDEITTIKKRTLRKTLKREYGTIFQFISLILEYSETQELDDALLESCLNAFKSFCKSMPAEFVFSTRIVDYILGHLNSPHSIATLECLHEIIELRKTRRENGVLDPEQQIIDLEHQKIHLIHSDLLKFFELYLDKFSKNDASSKLQQVYKKMGDQEKMFLKKYAIIFSSIYSNWIYELKFEEVRKGLGYLIQLTKLDDITLFKEVFPFWSKFIYEMYSEYPLRVPTTKQLKRNEFSFIFEAMLPVFVNNMPRPEEVFLIENELGDIIRDKKIETLEIDFYKKMRSNLFYLSFCIEDFMVNFFTKKIEKFIHSNDFDYVNLNKFCWSIGSIANALEESIERDFFVCIIKNLLTMCELRYAKEEKAIVASNIMFVIGQYYRFLKFHNEFLGVVIKKLFEFMEEKYEGIKKMACENFYKICEKCPNHFFLQKNKTCLYEEILTDLPAITTNLDYYLQRMVIEGLLTVLKNNKKKDIRYIEIIYSTLTNKLILDERYISSIHTVIHDPAQLKMAVHLVESYALGFKIIPDIFHEINALGSFLFFYKHISIPESSFNSVVSKNLQILKTTLAGFFETVVASGYTNSDFLNSLCESLILDFKITFDPAIISLATAIVSNTKSYESQIEIQRLQFFINNVIAPAVPYVIKSDEYIEVSKKYLLLLIEMAEKAFNIFFPLLNESPAYESIINSILFSLTGLHEVSSLALTTLKSFFNYSFENKFFGFFNRFYLICLENILGLIFDKDMRQNYELQFGLLYNMISYCNKIPALDNTGNNYSIVKDFITSLFGKNFRNLTEGSVKVFIEGIIEIKNIHLFKKHLDDFNVKIYEYGDDEDLQSEIDLLKERVSAGIN